MTALFFGAVSFLMPFVAIKENRVVEGLLIRGIHVAGPLINILFIIVSLAVLWAATMKKQPLLVWVWHMHVQKTIYLFAGLIFFWLSAIMLVQAGTLTVSGNAPRVSPGLGFWGLPIASYILINHAKPRRGKGRYFALLIVLLLPVVIAFANGRSAPISVVQEFTVRRGRFLDETIVHLRLLLLAVVFACLLGIPLGILASNNRRLAGPLVAFVDGIQTIPSMALFGLLLAPLAALSRNFPLLRSLGIQGIGAAPALIALTLYAILPVVRNTIAGLDAVPEANEDVGRGMGMSPRQLFYQVRWPMALPYVLAGLRTASVQTVGNTAVAALIGAGGLGIMIFQGLGQAAPDLILLGVIPLILLAVTVDRIWGWSIKCWVSAGLRTEGEGI